MWNYSKCIILKKPQVKAKKTRKFAAVKRMLNPNDIRLYVHLTASISPTYPQEPARQEGKPAQAEEKGGG